MSSDSLTTSRAQLDKEGREHLEDIVVEMRKRVEANVEFQLTQEGLDNERADRDSLDEETRQLVEAIELEAVDDGERPSERRASELLASARTVLERAERVQERLDALDDGEIVLIDTEESDGRDGRPGSDGTTW